MVSADMYMYMYTCTGLWAYIQPQVDGAESAEDSDNERRPMSFDRLAHNQLLAKTTLAVESRSHEEVHVNAWDDYKNQNGRNKKNSLRNHQRETGDLFPSIQNDI